MFAMFVLFLCGAISNPTSIFITGKDKDCFSTEIRWRCDDLGQSTIGFLVDSKDTYSFRNPWLIELIVLDKIKTHMLYKS